MKRGFAYILILVIIAVLIIGGLWYYKSTRSWTSNTAATPVPGSVMSPRIPQPSTPSNPKPPFSFSCPQGSTTAYEDPQMGVAFCYPADLAVTTGTIIWPNAFVPVIGPYSDPSQQPALSFGIIHEPFPVSMTGTGPGALQPALAEDIMPWEADGSNGSVYSILMKDNPITEGKNQNNFNYVWYRDDYVLDHYVDGTDLTVWSTSTGPFGFIPLIGQNYLVFYSGGAEPLPSYVDGDFQEILNTVAIMPEQYTGVGLTLVESNGAIDIYNVMKDSPAAAAGITAGERVLSVDGTSAASMSVDDVTNVLDTATGTVSLGIQNGNQAVLQFSLTPATIWVSGSDLAAMYEKPF